MARLVLSLLWLLVECRFPSRHFIFPSVAMWYSHVGYINLSQFFEWWKQPVTFTYLKCCFLGRFRQKIGDFFHYKISYSLYNLLLAFLWVISWNNPRNIFIYITLGFLELHVYYLYVCALCFWLSLRAYSLEWQFGALYSFHTETFQSSVSHNPT